MKKRSVLLFSFIILLAVGIAFLFVPFIKSFDMNAKQENDKWASCNLSDMIPGTIRECGFGMVYRRTQEDRVTISNYQHLLADPNMLESKQPNTAYNKWRSEKPEYFVFYPWAPHRRCGVTLKTANTVKFGNWKPPEYEALQKLPFFMEYCEGRTWDTSGRLYSRKNYPPEYNLTVPNSIWKSDTYVLIPTPKF